MIEFSTLCGSVKCFKFLFINGAVFEIRNNERERSEEHKIKILYYHIKYAIKCHHRDTKINLKLYIDSKDIVIETADQETNFGNDEWKKYKKLKDYFMDVSPYVQEFISNMDSAFSQMLI